jgi:hypothetical protein
MQFHDFTARMLVIASSAASVGVVGVVRPETDVMLLLSHPAEGH